MDSSRFPMSLDTAEMERAERDENILKEFGQSLYNNESLFEQGWMAQMDDMAQSVRPADLYAASFSPPRSTNKLSQAQLQMLRQIAMPTTSPDSQAHSGTSLAEDEHEGGKKRKSSADVEETSEPAEIPRPAKRNAHNVVEKRYRTNLNEKIAALRDAVPGLRVEKETLLGEDVSGDEDSYQKSGQKMNKATVLTKATEYIKQLEKRNKSLTDHNSIMGTRIAAFEKLLMSGALGTESASSATIVQYSLELPISEDTSTTNSPEGMIKVPEYIRKYNEQTQLNSQIYSVPQERYHIQNKTNAGDKNAKGSKHFGNTMVGSLSV
jgi:hypothetical protein